MRKCFFFLPVDNEEIGSFLAFRLLKLFADKAGDVCGEMGGELKAAGGSFSVPMINGNSADINCDS